MACSNFSSRKPHRIDHLVRDDEKATICLERRWLPDGSVSTHPPTALATLWLSILTETLDMHPRVVSDRPGCTNRRHASATNNDTNYSTPNQTSRKPKKTYIESQHPQHLLHPTQHQASIIEHLGPQGMHPEQTSTDWQVPCKLTTPKRTPHDQMTQPSKPSRTSEPWPTEPLAKLWPLW